MLLIGFGLVTISTAIEETLEPLNGCIRNGLFCCCQNPYRTVESVYYTYLCTVNASDFPCGCFSVSSCRFPSCVSSFFLGEAIKSARLS